MGEYEQIIKIGKSLTISDPASTPDIDITGAENIHYDIADFKLFAARNHNYANETYPGMKIHWHDDIELIVVRSGYTFYRLNDRVIKINAGEGVIINSRQLHCIESGDSDCFLDCVIFHPSILCSTKLIADKYVLPIIENQSIPYIMLSQSVQWQNEIFELTDELIMLGERENQELRKISIVQSIWNLLFANSDYILPVEKYYSDNLTSAKLMIDFVHNHYAEDITLKQICECGGVGKSTATVIFKKYTNSTPLEYVREHRVAKSMELLTQTDMSITEIALSVGFHGASFFAESFKKLRGMTPKEYRKVTEIL